jgi:hypothetical protein
MVAMLGWAFGSGPIPPDVFNAVGDSTAWFVTTVIDGLILKPGDRK